MGIRNGTLGDDRVFSILDDNTELFGLDGNDSLFPATGNDTLDGGPGSDFARFSVTYDDIPLFTNGATANLSTNTATAVIEGQTFTYTLVDIENLWGSVFSDVLIGDDADNIFQGLEGDDLIQGLGGDDRIFSGSGVDTLEGGEGNDSLFATEGDATLNGGGGDGDYALFSTTTGGNPIFDQGVSVDLNQSTVTLLAQGNASTYTLVGIENLYGSNFADTLIGDENDNVIFGYGGDDIIKGGAGDDNIRGEDGNDISLYDGQSNHFTIQYSVADIETYIVDRTGSEGTDRGGTNVLRFADRDFTVVADGQTYYDEAEGFTPAQFMSLVELYIAYFNRAPDAEGLNFWTLAVINGTTLDQAAEFFFDQPETRALYGAELDTANFVTSVYQNVLGRGPDEGGQAFWVNSINNGSVSEGKFIRDFLLGARAEPPEGASPEFIALQNADRAFLDTKTEIGANFGAVLGMSNVENANTVMSLFDGTAESLNAVQAATDAAYQAALATDGTGELLIQVVGFLDDPMMM